MGDPTGQLLSRMVNSRVTLTLKDSRVITGKLLGCDDHLNLVLDDVEESRPEMTRRLGLVVLRGSNVISLNSPSAGHAGNR